MDNNKARLELFRQAINTQADAEAAEITRQAEEKYSALAKEKSERSANEALSEIRAERGRISASFKKEISRCDFDMKKAVLAHRSELIDRLFMDIREKLSDYTKTPAYADYLRAAAAKAKESLGGSGTVLHARAGDIDALKALTDLPAEPDNSIEIGGITAENTAAGLFADFTLDSRLAEEKTNFSGRSELRL